MRTITFKDLSPLAIKYKYDINHNLRYLTLAKLVKDYQIKDVLVLGCGKGILEYILPDDVRCVSIDIESEQIKVAKDINYGKRNRSFLIGDIFNLPELYGKEFEAVIISEVIEHVRNDKEVIKTAKQFMRRLGGYFILTVPNVNRLGNIVNSIIGRGIKFMSDDHLREYDINEIYQILSMCGFKTIYTKFVYFNFLEELFVRRFISVDSSLREFILKIIPTWGTYIITVSILK